MKKFLSFLMIAVLAISLAACGTKEDTAIAAVKNATQIKVTYSPNNSNITQLDFKGNKLSDVMENVLKENMESYEAEWKLDSSENEKDNDSVSVIYSVTAQNGGEYYEVKFYFLYIEELDHIALYFIGQNGEKQNMDEVVPLFFAEYI
ncbi:hypothetical protein [Candidatus Soleaferrea massiliensis]|uniref:hypothetical protein n=1 Tax=Candidatus Soleaferrea massiliensis TaxID=1470354 RepID=UPI00058EC585|nr:hypothetical protein [Candidatus Soleaferrea massiliensis]